MIIVERADPHQPEATALLKESHALMASLFPPEDNFYLDIDQLCSENIYFYTARLGENTVGTAALVKKGDYGELKSMFVAETARGKGVANALVRQIEDAARQEGLAFLKLETGNLLHDAHRLYQRHGFEECEVFGGYADAKSSIFMQKAL